MSLETCCQISCAALEFCPCPCELQIKGEKSRHLSSSLEKCGLPRMNLDQCSGWREPRLPGGTELAIPRFVPLHCSCHPQQGTHQELPVVRSPLPPGRVGQDLVACPLVRARGELLLWSGSFAFQMRKLRLRNVEPCAQRTLETEYSPVALFSLPR